MAQIKFDKKGNLFHILSPGVTNLTLNDVTLRTRGIYYDFEFDQRVVLGSSIKVDNTALEPKTDFKSGNEVRVYFYNTETKDLEKGAFTIELELEMEKPVITPEQKAEELRLADRARRRAEQNARREALKNNTPPVVAPPVVVVPDQEALWKAEELRLADRARRRAEQNARKEALEKEQLLTTENESLQVYDQNIVQRAAAKRSTEDNIPEITAELLAQMFMSRI